MTETIEGEVEMELGQALELAGVQPPSNLFRTEDPAEVIRRATAVAQTLSDVLRKQNLTTTIGNREHVRVEGWTLCGTMLGVFPVCEWTRKLDDGWEARVEARTLSGAIVGAAESECLRSEKTWEKRDDYALRSMAQTRATSKALRQPLGFIVQLAGFDPTPAEEMPREATERRREGPPPYPVPKSLAKLKEAVNASDEEDAWNIFEAYWRAASYHLYGETDSKKLTAEQRKVVFQKAAGAACFLHDTDAGRQGPFAYFGVAEQRAAWASVLDGAALEIPDYSPPVSEDEAENIAEAERLAEETITGAS